VLWVFLIFGLLTLIAVLYGLATAWQHQGRMLKVHLLALVLLGIAWAEEHTTIVGWVGLVASTAIEVAAWSLWIYLRKGLQGAGQVLAPRITASTAKASAAPTAQRPASPAPSPATTLVGDAVAKAPAQTKSRTEQGAALEEHETGSPQHSGTGFLRSKTDIQPSDTGFQPCGTGSQPVQSPGDDAPPADDEPAVREEEPSEAEQTDAVRESPLAETPGEPAAGVPEDETVGDDPSPSISMEAHAADAGIDSHRLETGATAARTGAAELDAAATGLESDAQTATRSLRTIVLFKRRYVVAGGVFLASLRRNGQRDATAAQTLASDDAAWIHAGPIAMELRSSAEPCDANALNDVLAISPDGPESARLVAGHEAHATLTSVYSPQTPHDVVIRLHHRAHAALMEFAPVTAVVWPMAGRCVPADQLPALLDQAADPARPMARTCIQLRVFPLSEPNSGWVLTDCVGLCALGLPDIQIINPAQPDEAIVRTLHDLTERFLTSGCDLEDGTTLAVGDGPPGQVSHTRGAFPPDREVIQIALKRA